MAISSIKTWRICAVRAKFCTQ